MTQFPVSGNVITVSHGPMSLTCSSGERGREGVWPKLHIRRPVSITYYFFLQPWSTRTRKVFSSPTRVETPYSTRLDSSLGPYPSLLGLPSWTDFGLRTGGDCERTSRSEEITLSFFRPTPTFPGTGPLSWCPRYPVLSWEPLTRPEPPVPLTLEPPSSRSFPTHVTPTSSVPRTLVRLPCRYSEFEVSRPSYTSLLCHLGYRSRDSKLSFRRR